MEWTKIKAKHFLYTKLSNDEAGALAKSLLICAVSEQVPTEEILIPHIGRKSLANLKLTLSCTGVDLELIFKKVLEDVALVQKKRLSCKTKMQQLRALTTNVTPNVTTHVREMLPNREDKIREDKSININVNSDSSKLDEWNKIKKAYPNQASITKAMRTFFDSNLDSKKILQAIENYKNHLKEQKDKGFEKHAMNLSRFFEELDSWTEYKPPEKTLQPGQSIIEQYKKEGRWK